jgi:spore germination protein GerM
MEEQKSVSKGVVATVSALAASAIAIGGGVAWLSTHNGDRSSSLKSPIPSTINGTAPINGDGVNPPAPITPVPPSDKYSTNPGTPNPLDAPSNTPNDPTAIKPSNPTIVQGEQTTIKTWGVDDDGKKTKLVPRIQKIAKVDPQNPNGIIKASLDNLIATAGKKEGQITSTIPVGTKLLAAEVKPDGIHINLSKEFTQGAGATSSIARLGQVIYTATSGDRNAKVWISVEGKPLEVFGDVGVEVRQPMTRDEYDRDFPINPDPNDKG